ncbi:MAG TPA: hypothetical protein VFB06_30605 [Streptosporangiaceae bacterium]|nr:hypothetical protein [Streptosporangiaceae bacterium]
MSWLALVIILAVATAWSILSILWRRAIQRRRQREDDWMRFARGHRELDRDLDKVWHRK